MSFVTRLISLIVFASILGCYQLVRDGTYVCKNPDGQTFEFDSEAETTIVYHNRLFNAVPTHMNAVDLLTGETIGLDFEKDIEWKCKRKAPRDGL